MLVAQVRACIEAHAMLFPGAKVLVAVSGGADSMALLSVLVQLRSVYSLALVVVHINHQLRGEESERDALFVEEQAARLGVPFYQTRVDVTSLQRSARLSRQQAARQLRYSCFHALCQRLGAARVALGHTADDQAETLLMRLLRGSGPASLAGIPAVRLPFIRPLIAVSRPTIQAHLQSQNLPWVDDSSNLSPVYLRNRVRRDLLPALQRYNPQIVRRLNELADMLRADNQVLEQQVEEWATHTLSWQGKHRARLAWAGFRSGPVAVQRRLLRRLVEALSNTAEAVSFRQVEGLRQFILTSHVGQRWVLPGRMLVERQRESVLCWNMDGTPPVPRAVALAVPGTVVLGALRLCVTAEVVPQPGNVRESTPQQAFLDLDRAGGPLHVRFRQAGDRFHPLGAPGTKKLQDFFVDCRIPRAERPYVPLVVSEQEILWVVGHRIAEPYRLRPGTRRVLRLQCAPCCGVPDGYGKMPGAAQGLGGPRGL